MFAQVGSTNYDARFFKSLDLQTRYAAMLLFVSILITVEGVVRYIESDPKTPYDDMTGMQYRLAVGGAVEVFFGWISMTAALCVLAVNVQEPVLQVLALIFQIMGGAYVLCVYSIEQPVHNFENNMSPPVYPPDSFSRKELHAAVSVGYTLGGVAACALLFGFQIFCTITLLALQEPRGTTATVPILLGYSLWNNFLVLIIGVTMIVLGAMILEEEGSGEIEDVYIFPPNFVKSAPQTITSGCLLCAYACILSVGSLGADPFLFFSTFWALITWGYLMSTHVLAQISTIESAAFSGAAAALACLVSGFVVIPLFTVGQIQHSKWWEGIEVAEAGQVRGGVGGGKPSAVEVTGLVPSSPL